MIKLCWHKWTKWSDPVQTYSGNLQQWTVCKKCNKASFINLSWHQQTGLTTIIQAMTKAKGGRMTKAQQLAEKLKQYIPNGDGYNSDFANDLAEAVEHLIQDEQEPDCVLVPRSLIGAACSAINRKQDAPKILEQLRRYTVGDLSASQPAQQEHLDIQPLYTAPPKGGMMKPCIVIRDNKTTKLMEISKDGIWVNSEVPVNEVSTAVLAAIEDQIKLMIELQTERQSARLAELETLNADLLKQLSNYQVSWESQGGS